MEYAQTTHEGNITEVKVTGRIDALTAQEFEEYMSKVAESDAAGIVLNLAELDYISSAGLRSILKLAKSCKSVSKKLVLCSMLPDVASVFKISGFSLIIKTVADLDAALAMMAS